MLLMKRQSPRLRGFDYSQNGCYFVTICTHQRRALFGSIFDGSMLLSAYGKTAKNELLQIPNHFGHVTMDAYAIMPNHIHCILLLNSTEQAKAGPALPAIIGSYKSGVSRQIHHADPVLIVWQKSFYDRVLRDETAYQEILQYIEQNPLKWELDAYYAKDNDSC